MAIDLLQQILGGSPQPQQQDYLDFLRRYQSDPGSISDEEAARRYRELMRNAPAGMAADAHAQALDQLSPAERARLAERYQEAHNDPSSPFDGFPGDTGQASDPGNLGRMAHQAEQQDPDLFDKVFGQGSPLNSSLGKMVLAGVAAYMASRVLGGRAQQPAPQQAPGGGLGDLLDAMSGGGQAPQQAPGGGLGGLLDMLAGGGQAPQQAPGGGLGGLLDAMSGGGQAPQQAPRGDDAEPGLHVKGSKRRE